MSCAPLRRAFTLIELLIVVAIIAILAAIAVPNFLEAQTRSKVSRTRADMRTTAVALESYYVDANGYPLCHTFGVAGSVAGWDPANPEASADQLGILERLSTPIAYISQALTRDPFELRGRQSAPRANELSRIEPPEPVSKRDAAGRLNSYIYQSWSEQNRAVLRTGIRARQWLLHSCGPDGIYHNLGGVLHGDYEVDGPILLMYDPSNGTISRGSIYIVGSGHVGPGPTYAAGQGLVRAIRMSSP